MILYTTASDIPFGPVTSHTGCAIAHATNTPYFVISECGEYIVSYCITADNPAVAAGEHIDQSVELVSGISGVLDMIHFVDKKQTVHKKLIVDLQGGDYLYLRAKQPLPGEAYFINQQITITKTA